MNALTQPDTLSAMDSLDQLRKDTAAAAKLAARRDGLIVAARRAGTTWRAIAEAANLTELATRQAATRSNGGVLPTPGAKPRPVPSE